MSQRDSSSVDDDNTDDIQSRNIIRTPNKSIDNHEHDNDDNESAINRDWIGTNHSAIQESNHLHRNIGESPLEQIIDSIRQSHKRSNKSPMFSNESTYNSERLALSDLTDIATTNVVIDSMDSPKSRLHYPQNHQNNTHCQQQQRILLPAANSNSYQHQHLLNDGNTNVNVDNRINYRHGPSSDDQHRHISRNKHSDDRSTSPTSSSDAEFHSASRYSRNNRQHSSHRHRHNVNNDGNIYKQAINNSNQLENQHSSIKKQNVNKICHRYHEIGQPLTSCSPMCDSGMRCDDDCSLSSVPSNNRERSSSCEDVNGTMCSLIPTTATITTASTTMQTSNLVSQLPIVSVGNYHHHRGSSGISCESSTSSALTRNHGVNDNCISVERHLNSSRHNHHVIQPYALDHSQHVQNVHARETKSPLLIGFETIQVSDVNLILF
ncbi:hypothetical protein PV327_006234 [Microctonus hyperodae]|uniref:Uncharacterized protein n=1 Tax=Microctonus hyperodae TaxID=165561 RepID=A0AA39KI01_MICHY|nr:hypothetical protein PV327_006234 [Microctonus hyperodae]